MRTRGTTRIATILLAALTAPLAGQQSSAGSAEARQALEAELRAPNPIPAVDNVWIDELTWYEVRDAIAAGKTTAIIATGGIEQNGPYLVTGKHNVVLRGMCEAIARKLGNALCAPVIAFVPEGDIEQKTSHMRYPGTISVREETFRMLLEDLSAEEATETSAHLGEFLGGPRRDWLPAQESIKQCK
jgi:hypothetical protein